MKILKQIKMKYRRKDSAMIVALFGLTWCMVFGCQAVIFYKNKLVVQENKKIQAASLAPSAVAVRQERILPLDVCFYAEGTEMIENCEQKINPLLKYQTIPITIDTSNWKIYKNQKYGIQIKYPVEWSIPEEEVIVLKDADEFKISFKDSEGNNYKKGFDVYIKKNPVIVDDPKSEKIILASKVLAAEDTQYHGKCEFRKIGVPGNNIDPGKDYSFNIKNSEYSIDFVSNGKEMDRRSQEEFFESVSTFVFQKEIINEVRKISKPKIKAPMPYVYEVVKGQRVCNKKNDKPHKSDQNKKKHMDMECCLDPDEIPNPNCTYGSSIYKKLLEKLEK